MAGLEFIYRGRRGREMVGHALAAMGLDLPDAGFAGPTVVGLAIALGGCSIVLPLGPFGHDAEEQTGSIAPASPLSPELGVEDWRRAKSALAVALDPQGDGTAVRWDNPATGLKGAFSPAGLPFVKADTVCRAFLSTLALPESRTVSQSGVACRPHPDEWVLEDVKPALKGS